MAIRRSPLLIPLVIAMVSCGDPAGLPEVVTLAPDDAVHSIEDCDREVKAECPPDGGGGPETGGYQLGSAYSWISCTSNLYPDADTDGLNDNCEYEIARAFRPNLRISSPDNSGTVTRESYWTVRRDPSIGIVQIFYLLGYRHDYGSFYLEGRGSHKGDSEFIILRVKHNGSGQWLLLDATMSAHWGTEGDRTSRHVGVTDLVFNDVFKGRPRVWVSAWKHANYPTRNRCSTWPDEICALATMGTDVQVLKGRNIGQDTNDGGRPLINCVSSTTGLPGTECFFLPERDFYGWQSRSGSSAPSYYFSLHASGFIQGSGESPPGGEPVPCDSRGTNGEPKECAF